MNKRVRGNLGTLGFIFLSVGVLGYGFPFANIWTFVAGAAIWLLAVANARITELTCKE